MLVLVLILSACAPAATPAPVATAQPINPPADVVPAIQVTITDGNLQLDGVQAVYNFSLVGFCKTEADKIGNEIVCQPVVTVTAANGAEAVFSGAPGEVTPLPLVVLDDYRAKGAVGQIVSEGVTTSYEVEEVVEMQTGIQLKLKPVQ